MDRSLRKFLQLYRILRHSNVCLTYIAPLQSVQTISRTYSSTLMDHIQPEDVTLPMGKYHVSSNSKGYKSIRLLEEAASNYMNMTVDEAVDTMSAVFKSCRYAKDVPNIGKHIGFVRLCEVLNRNIRLMKTNDVIESLKVFTYFKIPSSSIIIQSLLQMIRTTINELSLRDIIFIVYLLKKMESTPLSDALLIALPLVFEAQLPTKLDADDISELTWSLRFTNENNIINQEIREIILKALLNYKNTMNTQAAWSVFHSLCSTQTQLSPVALEVLSDVQKTLTTNARELSVQQIIKILEKLIFAIGKNKEHGSKFYNEAIVDALVNSALSSNVNFADGIHLLKLLNHLNYAYIPFLEYLSAKCFEQPNLLKDASYFKLSVFLEGFVNADYKPVFWDTIRDAILAGGIENKSLSRSMIRFALHLTALDCYDPNLLDRVFSQNIQSNEPLKDIYARELLLLYQSVKTLYPTYDGPWPSQDILEHAIALGPILPTFSLRSALELALGGPQYIHNNLKTRLGHHIDHVVVMRKGRYPVAINTNTAGKNTMYIEDVQTPSESQMILIFNLPDVAYAVNSQRLKSTWSLKIKSAEAFTKSNTIAIHSTSWMKLPEYERVPYLMQAIKLKCEDFSTD